MYIILLSTITESIFTHPDQIDNKAKKKEEDQHSHWLKITLECNDIHLHKVNRTEMEPIAELDEHRPKHLWWYGATGTGKTWLARKQYPGAYIKSTDEYWDNYKGEPVAIVDNVTKEHIEYQDPEFDKLSLHGELTRWADNYPFHPSMIRPPYRGRPIRPELILVISNEAPDKMYGEVKMAKIRRLYSIVEFKHPIYEK